MVANVKWLPCSAYGLRLAVMMTTREFALSWNKRIFKKLNYLMTNDFLERHQNLSFKVSLNVKQRKINKFTKIYITLRKRQICNHKRLTKEMIRVFNDDMPHIRITFTSTWIVLCAYSLPYSSSHSKWAKNIIFDSQPSSCRSQHHSILRTFLINFFVRFCVLLMMFSCSEMATENIFPLLQSSSFVVTPQKKVHSVSNEINGFQSHFIHKCESEMRFSSHIHAHKDFSSFIFHLV